MSSGTTYQLNGVWGSSGSDCSRWVKSGRSCTDDGSSWSAMSSGTGNLLYSVWGSSGSNVFAVGNSGAILGTDDGSSWSAMSSGTNTPTAWGAAAGATFSAVGQLRDDPALRRQQLVGDEQRHEQLSLGRVGQQREQQRLRGGCHGTILQSDGSSWSAMSSGTTNYLLGIWGSSGSNVFAVGLYGTILTRATPAPAITTSTGPSWTDRSAADFRCHGDELHACCESGWTWGTDGGTISGSSTGSSVNVSWSTAGTKTLTASNSACGAASRDEDGHDLSELYAVDHHRRPCVGPTGQQLAFTASAQNCTPSATGWSWGTSGGTINGSSTGSSINVSWSHSRHQDPHRLEQRMRLRTGDEDGHDLAELYAGSITVAGPASGQTGQQSGVHSFGTELHTVSDSGWSSGDERGNDQWFLDREQCQCLLVDSRNQDDYRLE